MADENTEVSNWEDTLAQNANKADNDPWSPVVSETNCVPMLHSRPVDPLRNMKSSECYIQSLEKKLHRINGPSSKQLKSSDVIKSLQMARDQQTSQYLAGDTVTDDFSDIDYNNVSTLAAIQRKLNPEKQAINPVELVPLVNEDVLAKVSEEDTNKDDVKVT